MSAAIGSAAAIANTNQATAPNGFAELSSGEFLQIILSELSNQDPLAPNDTAAILEQLSSIRNIESQVALEDKLDALVTQNAVAAGSQMIGTYVVGLNNLNNEVEGLVESLSVQNGKPVLKLVGGEELPAERVTQVTDLDDLNGQAVQRLLMDLQVLDASQLIGMDVVGQAYDDLGNVHSRAGTVTGMTMQEGGMLLELDSGLTLPLANVLGFGSAGKAATPNPLQPAQTQVIKSQDQQQPQSQQNGGA